MILPLILLWAVNRRTATATPVVTRTSAPPWPTPASPPPPMRVFDAMPTPSADPSLSSTPLADLHNAPPELAPASSAQPGAQKAKARSVPDQIKHAAVQTFKKKATATLRSQAQQRADNAFRNFLTPKSDTALSVPVLDIQTILNKRGIKVVRDGLYGPKTASAWAKLANSKHLPPTISRVAPKTVKVVTRTYDALSMPAIP